MDGEAPPAPLPDELLAAFRRLDQQLEEALHERNDAKREQLSVAAISDACRLLERLMEQPSFRAAMRNIEGQNLRELVEAIGQLRTGRHMDAVVAELGELLNRAHIPNWFDRRTIVDGVAHLL